MVLSRPIFIAPLLFAVVLLMLAAPLHPSTTPKAAHADCPADCIAVDAVVTVGMAVVTLPVAFIPPPLDWEYAVGVAVPADLFGLGIIFANTASAADATSAGMNVSGIGGGGCSGCGVDGGGFGVW